MNTLCDPSTKTNTSTVDSSEDDAEKIFKLGQSPPSFPSNHFYSNRYWEKHHAQLIRPTSLQTYDPTNIKTDKSFQERLYGGGIYDKLN